MPGGERALAMAGLARFSDAELGRIAQAVEAEVVAAERSKANERSKARDRGQAAEPLIPLRAAVMMHWTWTRPSGRKRQG
jgi:hypothetical protein